jgi:hypothetical protein
MMAKGERIEKKEIEALVQRKVSIPAFIGKNPRAWRENMTSELWRQKMAGER